MNEDHAQFGKLASLKELSAPSKEYKQTTKSALLRAIKSDARVSKKVTTSEKDFAFLSALHVFFSRRFLIALKPGLTVFLAVVIATSGWIASVSASVDSVPGDALWGVKIASEKTQLAVASISGSSEKQAKLNIKFANRRAVELKKVLADEEPADEKSKEKKVKAIKNLNERLQTSLESTNKTLKKVQEKETDSKKVVKLIKQVHVATVEVSKTLKESADAVVEEAGKDAAKDLVKTEKALEDVSLHAVEIALEEAGELDGTQEDDEEVAQEVATIVEEALTELVENADENIEIVKQMTEKSAEQAESLDEGNESDVSEIVLDNEPTSTSTMTSTLHSADEVIEDPINADDVVDVIKKVDETVEAVEANKQEIQKLIEDNQLHEAVQKVRELSDVVNEVKEVVVEVDALVDPEGEEVLDQVDDENGESAADEDVSDAGDGETVADEGVSEQETIS